MSRFFSDMEAVAATLDRLLSPFGWHVSWAVEQRVGYCSAARGVAKFRIAFTLNAKARTGHLAHYPAGTRWVCSSEFSEESWQYATPGFLERLPHQFAEDAMHAAWAYIDPPLPAAPKQDWRPDHVIPEDYYA